MLGVNMNETVQKAELKRKVMMFFAGLQNFRLISIFLVACVFFMIKVQANSQTLGFQTSAKQAVVLDFESGSVLFQKNADELMAPASMAKLMTMEVVFNGIKNGDLTYDSVFRISEDAWKRGGANSGGSTMFAKLNSDVRLEDLIRGVIIQSGNDAAMAIAEGMAGSEIAFAGVMNARAQKIGLEKSHFTNATGLPDPAQKVTARELAYLARHLIKQYPEQYKIYSEKDFTWNKIRQRNRNPLLGKVEGADGLKTGHTEESGYGLVASAVVDGRRLIMVLNGLETARARSNESIKMLRWAFRAFKPRSLFAAGEVVGEASVYGGEKSGVELVAKDPLFVFLPVGFQDRLKAKIVYTGPIKAPVEEGLKIAKLQVIIDGKISQETPLYAAEDVALGSLSQRAMDAAQELIIGLFH